MRVLIVLGITAAVAFIVGFLALIVFVTAVAVDIASEFMDE